MKTKITASVDKFLDLVKRHPLRPIRTAAEHKAAVDVVRSLMLRPQGQKLDADESDYLGTLGMLVSAYERDAMPMPKRAPFERLKFVVEEAGTTQAELAGLLGLKQPAVSLILAGKRGLSGDAVKLLAAHFKLNAAYFL